ncbi:DUF4190 domain-containing protein [Fontivita pretiosa]|uniref:DUF4190 domain-containing protein n=1 Tax=Fontivita pretiosa TaxID=2989684 RepID=UPI003D18768A
MSQMPPQQPPPTSYGAFPPPGAARTNGMAVASLICGLLICVPVLTSLLAIVFGILGIRKANQTQVGGKGMAIAGLVLGVLGILGWVSFGTASYMGFHALKDRVLQPAEQTGSAFFTSLAEGDTAKAQSYTTGKLSSAELESLSAQLKGLGSFKDFSISRFDADSSGGNSIHIVVAGSANFQNGSKRFTATLVGDVGQKTVKIQDLTLE